MALAPTPSRFNALIQPPVPPPLKEAQLSHALKSAIWRLLLTVEAMMVVAVIMSCIMLLGSLRKRTSNAFFKLCVWVNVVLTPMVISFCVGLMTNLKFDLFPVWGIILLVGMASYGTISAFELEDNETAMTAYLQGFLKCSFLFVMLLHYDGRQIPSPLWWSMEILSFFLFYRVIDRVFSLIYASKTNLSEGVGSKVEIVAEYMAWDAKKTLQAEEEEGNPKTMDGYRYLVGMSHLLKKGHPYSPPCYKLNFEKEMEDIVTIQDIWQCEGELLSSRGGDPEGRLKDTCLSYALFWMLLRRYIRYPLAEVSSLEGKTWKFVRYGLIPDISRETSERAFRVIEQELSFLYDYFYTKNFAVCSLGTGFMFIRLLIMLAFFTVAELILRNHKPVLPVKFSDHLPAIKMDVIITRVVIYAMLTFELILMIHYLFMMQWSRVEWVCTYVRKKLWRSQTWKDICLRWAIENICRFPSSRNLKHWKREIDQYSLLLSHDRVNPIYYLRYVIPPLDVPKRGRKASKSIPFSMNLKVAVLSSLHTNGRQLTNGRTSLRKYGLENDLHWALNLETHTQTILVWHIATSFCELNHLNRYPGNLRPEYLLVARSLSEYCAYLVAFAPELLPDHTNTTFKIINYVIREANIMFQGCSNMESKYEMMMAMADQTENAGDYILFKGVRLGKSLVNRMDSDESLWEMLGEFWAELLLYLAPSDNVDSHIKHLANGGQLITHLWTLLTHAGILTRD